MGDITLTFSGGRTGLTEEALEQRLQAAAPLLAEVLAGEAQHRDNLGWFSVDEAAGPERVERLRVILSYLHENYGEKITLEDVAKQVGLCKSECCRFFKRQMGQSLFDYLLDYRIGRSLALLEEGGATVAEVASQVGFSNPAYFSKVFRARMGRSPREYQKQGAAVGPEGGDAL